MSNTQTPPHPPPSPHPSHLYHIFSKGSGFIVGRKGAEDRSGLPKAIYTLNPEITDKEGGRLWTFEPGSRLGHYKIKAGGNAVGDRHALLWAFLDKTEQAQATEWIVTPVPQAGPDAYIILSPDDLVGWAAAKELHPEHEQIRVQPLISGRSHPPYYPPHEVFIIKRAKE
ncbi:hypothetical protein NM688_g2415 [Phlebia brevispora]|uniref:Uncharacterized protein n=1 Tax=Phlebia brevispora TaxID=194682 RepID=A0ACC1T8P8_9APHY|nr:hypothetical protein NM688_g2415 [Phlebia brevispora]